ncbi:hypothetical protein Tco_0581181 [Tanacetum coccineum]
MDVETGTSIFLMSTEGGDYVLKPEGSLDPDHPEKVLPSQETALYGLKQAPRAWTGLSASSPTQPPLYAIVHVIKQRPTQKHLQEAFSDADHAGCIDTRKSTSGGIQFLGDKFCAQVMWNEEQLHRLWLQLQQNTVVLRLSVCHSKSHDPTEYQLADMFTKALPEDRFKYLVRRIGMRCLTPAELEVLTNETA